MLKQCVTPHEANTLVMLGLEPKSHLQHAVESSAPRPGEHMLLPAWTLSELIPLTELTDAQCISVIRADNPVQEIVTVLIAQLVEAKQSDLKDVKSRLEPEEKKETQDDV